ncbi:MAG: rRNA maturation RNase YbeY [Planctomycetota bacterium]|nr:rRNA maturation RNase YbeY [Planctomycetota bacterium]
MISISNLQRKIRVPRKRLERLVRLILRKEKKARGDVSFAIVDNRRIRKLNRQYLNHDYATDVLAFPMASPLLGEVILSAEYAIKEAKSRGISPQEELLRYAAHGLLHLLGYDDHDPGDKKIMWARQEQYLEASRNR